MTLKNVVAWMRQSSCSRIPFETQSVHESQTLLNSAGHHRYPNFAVIQHILNQKTSLFVRPKIIRVFGKALATDHMHSRHNWGKLPQHVKTPLSQKEKTFFRLFIAFLQSPQSFAHFEKKAQLYSLNSWEVIDSEKCRSLNAQNLLFQNTLPQSKSSREPNTAEIRLAGRLS